MKTLVVIDMQHAWLRRPSPCHDVEGVIARINQAARTVRAEGGHVIFVVHECEESPRGTQAFEVDARLEKLPQDGQVVKAACDSFADTDLLQQLKAHDTSKVYLCGFATDFCVDTAVRAAPSHGLKTVVLSDAHTVSNRPHLTAAQVVTHHNWLWSNFSTPVNGSLTVMTAREAFGV